MGDNEKYAVEIETTQRRKVGPPRRERVCGKGEELLLAEKTDAVLRFHEAQFQVHSGLPLEGRDASTIRALRLVRTNEDGVFIEELGRWENPGAKGRAA